MLRFCHPPKPPPKLKLGVGLRTKIMSLSDEVQICLTTYPHALIGYNEAFTIFPRVHADKCLLLERDYVTQCGACELIRKF